MLDDGAGLAVEQRLRAARDWYSRARKSYKTNSWARWADRNIRLACMCKKLAASLVSGTDSGRLRREPEVPS
jgi:hypothetical protein